MLVTLLLSSNLIAAPPAVAQNSYSAGACPTLEVLKAAYKAGPVLPVPGTENQILPSAQFEGKGLAVLLPDCRNEPQKRRKRKSDYPMA